MVLILSIPFFEIHHSEARVCGQKNYRPCRKLAMSARTTEREDKAGEHGEYWIREGGKSAWKRHSMNFWELPVRIIGDAYIGGAFERKGKWIDQRGKLDFPAKLGRSSAWKVPCIAKYRFIEKLSFCLDFHILLTGSRVLCKNHSQLMVL